MFRRGDRLKRADVVDWAAFAFGPRHAGKRVTEHKATFVVDTVSDKVYDGHHEPPGFDRLWVVVLKKTGAFWDVGHGRLTPDIYAASTGEAFGLAMTRAGLDPDRPPGRISRARERRRVGGNLDAWVRSNWARADIHDNEWGYQITFGRMLPGATAPIVLKSNGSEWRSWSGAPASIDSLADEQAFHALCATTHGPECVTDWLTRPG